MIQLLDRPAIQITIVLVAIPIIFVLMLVAVRVNRMISRHNKKQELKRINDEMQNMAPEEAHQLELRKTELEYQLSGNELTPNREEIRDPRGLITESDEEADMRFLIKKRKQVGRVHIDEKEKNLILWFLGSAIVWLVIGTSVGEYLGIKFVAPDADHQPWLSFGRLRPVHTNMVFWGWSSMAMVGLSYFVVPRVGNTKIFSLKLAKWSLVLMNACIILGTISLMAGINNSGGEYREYIWPIMGLFATAIVLTLYNHIKTIVNRKTKEIYVSNWYIVAATMCIGIVAIVGYLPFWQNGLGETITQGYYMHMAVGMWFMFLNLGCMYYFLPQELDSPVYSYSLSVLAFWTQIFFYTLIGTHHFIFTPIPWWIQTVAIVASVGMVIPVTAGSVNFMLTIRGSWHRLRFSYVLPFYVVGIIFYFTGSMQGSVEALRWANLVWHLNDFAVAHSHMTMYGIIAFMLWAFTYTIVPRLTGKQPSSVFVGLHFWLALVGLLLYTFSLMIGGTEKGLMWMDKVPFIDTVVHSAPYWLWRAIGGSLMWASHLIFAYNFYIMVKPGRIPFQTGNPRIDNVKDFDLNKTTSNEFL